MNIVAFIFVIALISNIDCSGIFFKASNTDKKHFAANSNNVITQELHECSSTSKNVCNVVAPSKSDGKVEKAKKDLKNSGTISQMWMKDPLGK